ncbi:hypothetical protein [Glutamicibacter protophormiae]|uniref:hypothetical protein n=1 Tax=Glutamicibacter protophormiae TaxID=37930 RepID=UPI001EF4EB2C|nr:hypothetical protein [Glutamicibacter protophormiae]
MSDNSQPVSSRRALREKRRAEMEALLANSKAEQAAKEQADKKAKAESANSDSKDSSGAAKSASSAPKPALAKAAEAKAPAKPAAKPAAEAKAPAKPAAKPAAAAKQPAANSGNPKTPAKPAPKPAEKAPAAKSAPKPQPAKPVDSKPAAAKPAETKLAPAKSASNKPAQSKPAESKPAASKTAVSTSAESPAVQKPEALGERASLRRARDREALRERRRLEEEVGSLTSHVPTVEPADDPKPLTRRQLRLQALADQNKGAAAAKPVSGTKPAKPSGAENAPDTTVMSVEEALAARRAHDPKSPVDPVLLGEDDSEIDLEVLAHQREMAARAAIISRRAAERERLRIENSKQGKEDVASDPFTGAMGNIREVEERIAKTGVSGPKTESVSLSLDAQGKIDSKPAVKPAPKPAAKAPAKPAPKPAAAAKPAAKPVQKPVAKPAPAAKPTPVTKAPAAAKPAAASAPESKAVELPRIEAVNAQGLQPLDVQTHGVRRANNMLIAMIVALGVGSAALVAGLIMLLTN